MALRPVVMA